MKRTTIWLADADREAIATIRRRYGVTTDSDAIRVALRVLAGAERLNIDLHHQRPGRTGQLPAEETDDGTDHE